MNRVVDVVFQSGISPAASSDSTDTCRQLGLPTNPKQYFRYRFSQDLPSKTLFRHKMAPKKKKPNSAVDFFRKELRELENAHLDTTMPPSIHVEPENRPLRIRSPCLVRGTLFRKASTATTRSLSMPSSQFSSFFDDDPPEFYHRELSSTWAPEQMSVTRFSRGKSTVSNRTNFINLNRINTLKVNDDADKYQQDQREFKEFEPEKNNVALTPTVITDND